MEVSYKDWIAARDRIFAEIVGEGLGPYAADRMDLMVGPSGESIRGVWVGFHVKHAKLTPDEAEEMALALTEHAAYARQQETPKESICGHTLTRSESTEGTDAICQRPKGHDYFCHYTTQEEK